MDTEIGSCSRSLGRCSKPVIAAKGDGAASRIAAARGGAYVDTYIYI